MGRMYAATFASVAVTAAQDLFTIGAPSDACVIIHSVQIGQSSDAKDAEDEQLPLLVHRPSAAGSGGTAGTARPLNVGDAAFGGTVDLNDTTQSTPGNIILADAFNVRAGWVWIPTPECRPVISPSGFLTIELAAAPADSLTMSGTVMLEEIGG